jgi:hypothetical protein
MEIWDGYGSSRPLGFESLLCWVGIFIASLDHDTE